MLHYKIIKFSLVKLKIMKLMLARLFCRKKSYHVRSFGRCKVFFVLFLQKKVIFLFLSVTKCKRKKQFFCTASCRFFCFKFLIWLSGIVFFCFQFKLIKWKRDKNKTTDCEIVVFCIFIFFFMSRTFEGRTRNIVFFKQMTGSRPTKMTDSLPNILLFHSTKMKENKKRRTQICPYKKIINCVIWCFRRAI